MINRLIVYSLCFFLYTTSAYAHPHIFLTNKVHIVFENEGIKGFKTFWYADDFSTAGLTDGYDENENGKIDDFEIKILENDAAENLKQFNYYTYIEINGKNVEVKSIDQFKAELIDGKIVYSFFIPKKIKAGLQDTEITIYQYDSTYFSFISFSENQPVSIINGTNFTTDYRIEVDKNETYYFDMMHPIALSLRFKK